MTRTTLPDYLYALLLLAASAPAPAATIDVTIDTPDLLAGTFSATTTAQQSFDFSGFQTSVWGSFAHRNTSNSGVFVERDVFNSQVERVFGTNIGVVAGDWPRFSDVGPVVGSPVFFDELVGAYTSQVSGEMVRFAFTDLRDDGGAIGSFTGSFQFAVVPEPSSVLVLGSLGIAAFGARHRGRRAAPGS